MTPSHAAQAAARSVDFWSIGRNMLYIASAIAASFYFLGQNMETEEQKRQRIKDVTASNLAQIHSLQSDVAHTAMNLSTHYADGHIQMRERVAKIEGRLEGMDKKLDDIIRTLGGRP